MDLSLSLAKPDEQTFNDDLLSSLSLPHTSVSQDSKSQNLLNLDGAAMPCQTNQPPLILKRQSAVSLSQTDESDNRSSISSRLPIVNRLATGIPWLFALIFTFLVVVFNYTKSYMPSPKKWVDNWSTLSLVDCLAHYFSVTELVGENKYYCEKCNQQCNGRKQFKLYNLPEILTLHVKRFSNNHMYSSKLSSPVNFPLKNLDLKPFLHSDCTDKVATYDLIGVICHYGSCSSGHYVTYAFNKLTNNWYEFDDEQVRKLDPEHVETLRSSAYILFYRKRHMDIEIIRQNLKIESGNKTGYISKSWLVRFWTWAEPGPITAEFLCEHGQFDPNQWNWRYDWVSKISDVNFMKLHGRFGGQNIIYDLSLCTTCCDAIRKRQNYEHNEFFRLQSLDNVSSTSYVISKKWLNSWFCYAKCKTLDAPGPIDNTDLVIRVPSSFYSFGGDVSFKYSLSMIQSLSSDEYDVLSYDVWNFLFGIYKVYGPIIPIYTPLTTRAIIQFGDGPTTLNGYMYPDSNSNVEDDDMKPDNDVVVNYEQSPRRDPDLVDVPTLQSFSSTTVNGQSTASLSTSFTESLSLQNLSECLHNPTTPSLHSNSLDSGNVYDFPHSFASLPTSNSPTAVSIYTEQLQADSMSPSILSCNHDVFNDIGASSELDAFHDQDHVLTNHFQHPITDDGVKNRSPHMSVDVAEQLNHDLMNLNATTNLLFVSGANGDHELAMEHASDTSSKTHVKRGPNLSGHKRVRTKIQ